jgi:hypothetical protein
MSPYEDREAVHWNCHNTDCCVGHDLIGTTDAIDTAGDGELLATWLARTVEVALWVIEANRECPLSDGVADGEWQDTTFGDELWGLFPAVAADLRATIAQGILQVDVPAQPPARLPHVVSEAAPFPRGVGSRSLFPSVRAMPRRG